MTAAREIVQTEIDRLLCGLYEEQSRARIVRAWCDGRIDGDAAIEIMIACDLVGTGEHLP